MEITEKHIDLLSHALGVNFYHCKNSKDVKFSVLPDEFYRNYYNYGLKTKEIQELEDEGLIELFIKFGNTCFSVKNKGMVVFMNYFKREVTDKFVPLSKNKQKYLEYMHQGDCFNGFSDYLGIQLPKREYSGGKTRFVSTKYNTVKGEYCLLIKDAKASYKLALKNFKNNQNGH